MFSCARNAGGRRAERGSALVTVVFIALVMAGVLAYAFSDSYNGMLLSQTRANKEKAIAAAEYGAELAMAQLTRVSRGNDGTGAKQGEVSGDFVYGSFGAIRNGGNLYRVGGNTAQDQRRIAGVMDDQQFRVRIRSAGLAHNVGNLNTRATMPESWLLRPPAFSYDAPTGRFQDYYEITSTAQHNLAVPDEEGRLGISGSQVSLQGALFPSAVVQAVVGITNSGVGGGLDEAPSLHLEDASYMQATNAEVSGEDHNLKKHVIEGGTVYMMEPTVVGQGQSTISEISTSEGSYWHQGNVTLNYMRGAYPIPYYPRTKKFGDDDDGNREMTSIGQRTREAGSSGNDSWESFVKTFLDDKDVVRSEADIYLLGGKSSGGIGYSVTTLPKEPWTIKETSSRQASSGKPEPPLADYDDLLRLYIVRSGEQSAVRKTEDVILSNKKDAPYNKDKSGYRNNKGKTEKLPYDSNVETNYMNFIGKKLYDLEHSAADPASGSYASISLPYYNDPFDNAAITVKDEDGDTVKAKVPRYFSRQYVVRRKPGTERDKSPKLQILAMNTGKVALTAKLLEGVLLNTNGRPVNFDNEEITWTASSYTTGKGKNKETIYISGKKVVWELASDEPYPQFTWDPATKTYRPEEETVVIQLRNYPNENNNRDEDKVFGGTVNRPDEDALNDELNPMITARWPNLFKNAEIVPGTGNLDRDKVKYRVRWADLGLKGLTKDGNPATSGSNWANFFPDSYAKFGQYSRTGVYVSDRFFAGNDGYQWFEWDGSYVWKDFFVKGDGSSAHIQAGESWEYDVGQGGMGNYLAKNNVMARPFDIDELMGKVMKHDFRTLDSQKYGKVVVVDKDGNAVAKKTVDENDKPLPLDKQSYPGSVPLRLTGPVKNGNGIWTGWRSTAPDVPEDEAGIRIYDPDHKNADGEPDVDGDGFWVAKTMNDLLENIPQMENGKETTVKKGVTLLVMVEDQYVQPDWDYNDLSIITTIYPYIPSAGKEIDTGVDKNYQDWWEQEGVEGLTGGESTAAISTNGVNGNTDPELAYQLLWNTLTWDEWMRLDASHRVDLLGKAKKAYPAINLPNNRAELERYPTRADFDNPDSGARDIVIAALSQDMYSMMNTDSKEFSTFGRRGEFRLKTRPSPVFDNAEMPYEVQFIPPANEDRPLVAVYYSNNDVRYYMAVCDTEAAIIDVKMADHAASADEEVFRDRWESWSEEDRMKYAAGDSPNDLPASNIYLANSGNAKRMRLRDHIRTLGYQPLFITEREEELIQALVAINGSRTEASSLRVLRQTITAREFSAGVFNRKALLTNQRLPNVLTVENPDRAGEWMLSDADNPKTGREALGYLAGEMLQDASSADSVSALTDQYVPFTDYYDNGDTIQADGSVVTIRKFLAKNDGAADGIPDPEELDKAVAMCYVEYFGPGGPDHKPEVLAAIEEKWGPKDKRRSIGWHRYGAPDAAENQEFHDQLKEEYLFDHSEIVMLGVEQHHPFHEIDAVVANQPKRLLQLRRVDDIEYVMNKGKYEPRKTGEYRDVVVTKSGSAMPTFVFNEPIDGAGILVVNGNMLIKDTFAFHGVFVVMGSVTVESTHKPDRCLFGDDGNYLYKDSKGELHSLKKDKDGYYYKDKEGNFIRGEDLAPLTAADLPGADQYTGHLVVQGSMIAGGTLRTTVQKGHEGKTTPGRIDLYSSQEAKKMADELLQDGTLVAERLVWTHNDNIDVHTLWTGEMDR